MNRTGFLATLFALTVTFNAKAAQPLTCAFERPLIFGASISAGYSTVADGVNGRLNSMIGWKYQGSSPSPGERLAHKINPSTQITNIAELVNAMPHSGYGIRQVTAALSDPALAKAVNQSTILISLDSFYWPAADGVCEEAIQGVQYVTEFAMRNHKPLVLATVPADDPAHVGWLLNNVAWYPPQQDCVTRINLELKEQCRPENHCYLIDIFDIVKHLNSDGIIFEGKTNFTFDFRFDGIHLTPRGNRYLQSQILTALERQPPSCSN